MLQIIKKGFILKFVLISIFMFAFSSDLVFGNESNTQKFVAFTIDDLPVAGGDVPVEKIKVMTEKLLTGLKKNHIPAIGFLNEKLLYRFGEVDKRIDILRMWLRAGFELGNHTFSHFSLNTIGLKAYEEDVVRGDTVTKIIMAEAGLKPRYFRHPFLVTGSTLNVKNSFENFLAEYGYKVAPVTMEALDWEFNLLYINAKKNNDTAKMSEIIKKYLNFTSSRIDFFENFSDAVLGYQVKQILLLHANELNADCIDELVKLFVQKKYKFISLDEALQDKAYRLSECVKPDNVTWIYRWGCAAGKLTYSHQEPKPPADISTEFKKALSKETDISRYGNNIP